MLKVHGSRTPAKGAGTTRVKSYRARAQVSLHTAELTTQMLLLSWSFDDSAALQNSLLLAAGILGLS
jgi:hypothetical protein